MPHNEIVYLVFGMVLVIALVADLGLMSKKGKVVTMQSAIYLTLFWVLLAFAFFVFMWMEEGHKKAIEYISAYLMEWSLSIDNIFVFILIFNAFKIKEVFYSRVLLIGILMAIVFRVVFITVGVGLVEQFHWVLYIFGAFLVYTGFKMFTEHERKEFSPKENKIYRFLQKFLPLTSSDGNGRFIIRVNNKPQYTILFVTVVMLASVDLIFALDSIPAVMGISQDRIIIYTSNIFAILGLRSLFFLLRGAVNKFAYLQQGISVVLILIGAKMIGEKWVDTFLTKNEQVFVSLLLIIVCIGGSVLYSIFYSNKQLKKNKTL
ncbi:TerC/Alx family metal homeostasis membrane protein [Hydrotalea sp.]|uniref:TerC/Alx family metal homeostasis membrane protein n=1 Tax=Hydrotalea sp. TaxID=2881279 RepID=UPI002623E8F7|nr:TerC/Alx family metal homeostasis membrane protein [Hydrotalea sp.]